MMNSPRADCSDFDTFALLPGADEFEVDDWDFGDFNSAPGFLDGKSNNKRDRLIAQATRAISSNDDCGFGDVTIHTGHDVHHRRKSLEANGFSTNRLKIVRMMSFKGNVTELDEEEEDDDDYLEGSCSLGDDLESCASSCFTDSSLFTTGTLSTAANTMGTDSSRASFTSSSSSSIRPRTLSRTSFVSNLSEMTQHPEDGIDIELQRKLSSLPANELAARFVDFTEKLSRKKKKKKSKRRKSRKDSNEEVAMGKCSSRRRSTKTV